MPFFVLCHFCSSNGSKVTGLHIKALHMTSVSDIFPSNDWKRQTKSYISIYWTDRETETVLGQIVILERIRMPNSIHFAI